MSNERGTLVSSGHSVKVSEMEEALIPSEAISVWTAEVVEDLVSRVGYLNKIAVTIQVIDGELRINAKTRLEN